VVQFEARGIEPMEYEFRGGGWKAKALDSNTVYTGLEFTVPDKDGVDWCDFDEESNHSVGVYNLKSRFIHTKL